MAEEWSGLRYGLIHGPDIAWLSGQRFHNYRRLDRAWWGTSVDGLRLGSRKAPTAVMYGAAMDATEPMKWHTFKNTP